MPSLIKMIRGDDLPAPHVADVHPDEVDNYLAGGWMVAAKTNTSESDDDNKDATPKTGTETPPLLVTDETGKTGMDQLAAAAEAAIDKPDFAAKTNTSETDKDGELKTGTETPPLLVTDETGKTGMDQLAAAAEAAIDKPSKAKK